MSSFSLLGLVNLVGIVCAALAFLLYLRHAARRLEAKEAKEEERGQLSAPAETAVRPSLRQPVEPEGSNRPERSE